MTGGAQDSGVVSEEAIDKSLVENCGRGIPFAQATDMPTMLHGLAYLLRQLSACPGYKPNVGQIGPATTAVNMALRTFAKQALSTRATRATPAPAGWQEGEGWVFWNPDSGEEYAPNHPVESGECTDAESVRRSTPQEDTLYLAFQNEFARAEHLTNVLREIEASASTAVSGSRTFPTAPAEGGV